MLAALGRVVGVATEPRVTRDDVNQAMIRHWCDAMTDHNPVYTDPAFAAESVHGGIVAPPAMLDTWSMPGLAPRPRQESSSGEEAGMVP
ncbi:MAG TPA: hypothetical protein EYQ35_02850, partial [candidate division UBP10 bacterium]|nr:hypothetical protein [Candidatus Binatota bacterium]